MYDSPTRSTHRRQTSGSRRALAPTVAVALLVTAGVVVASLGPASAAFLAGAVAGSFGARVTTRHASRLADGEATYRLAGLDVEVALSTTD